LAVLAPVDRVSANSMAADIFNSPERDRFFQSIDFPWYNLAPSSNPEGPPLPYALYHCETVEPQQIADLRQASEAVGQVLLEAWQVVRDLDDEDLESYGFPPETWRCIRADDRAPWCMRLDWCWNHATQTYKVIEVNSQTPSFWYETTVGNGLVAQHFGLKPIDPTPDKILRSTLQQQLQQAAQKLRKPLEHCNISFTALNNPEDLNTMDWLSRYVPHSHVFPLENLRLDNGRQVYNQQDSVPIDILFLWYPLEWLILDTDSSGEPLWPELERLILENRVVVINFGSAFALQSKGVFALIHELRDSGHLTPAAAATVSQYFAKTALDEIEIGDNYFAKPIFGRQGEGAVAVINGEDAFTGNLSDPFYTEQPYIYQELLEFPRVQIADREMTELWGVWLYNEGVGAASPGRNRFVADALGKRLSVSKVTDDGAYWCPIGLA
jgi:glutathionylspermidine synthase